MNTETNPKIEIHLIHIEEKSFKLDLSEDTNSACLKENLKINIGYSISPDITNNTIVLEVAAKYVCINNTILDYTASLTFRLENMSSIIEISDNKIIEKATIIPTLLNVAIGTLRGMLAIKTVGTILKDYPIPLINVNSILKNGE